MSEPLDPTLLDALARVYMRAALDALLAEMAKESDAEDVPTQPTAVDN